MRSLRSTQRWRVAPQSADRSAEECGGDTDSDGPAELGERRGTHLGKIGDRERGRHQSGQRVQPDEDQRPDAGRQQAGHQDDRDRRSAEPRHLHEQEGAEQGRAEQRADGGEAAGRADQGDALRRSIVLDQVHPPGRDAAAEGDQRRLRAQDRSERQGHQRSGRDAGQVPGRRRPGRPEAVDGRLAAVPREPPDDESHEESTGRHHGQRPPGRHLTETQCAWKVREEPALRVEAQLEEPVGQQRDGRAEDGREDENHHVSPRPQQRRGVRWRCLAGRCGRGSGAADLGFRLRGCHDRALSRPRSRTRRRR